MGSLVGKATGMLSGGGTAGAVPNAPDVSGNIKNANKTFDTATSNAGQTFSTAQAYNQNAQDQLAKVTGGLSPVLNNVGTTASSNLDTYNKTFMPLLQQQATDASNYTAQNTDRLKGMAIADTNAGYEAARKNAADRLAAEGVDPASIQGGALDRQAAIQQAAAAAGAGTRSVLDTENTGRNLVAQANQLGLQVGQQGNQGAQVGGVLGSEVVGNTNSTNANGVNNLTAANGALGIANTANTSGANIASQNFADQMKAYDAQQAQASAGGDILGGVLGGAGKLFGGNLGSIVSTVAPLAGLAALDKGGVVPRTGALPIAPPPGHPTDTTPAMLTPDEFVIPKNVAVFKGHEYFHKQVAKAHEEMAIQAGILPPKQKKAAA